MTLGNISGKYESNNRADIVSTGNGDLGGISYGAHQFIAPVANAFVKWLQQKGEKIGELLAPYSAGTEGFTNMWKQAASIDYEHFLHLQHEYTKMQYYDAAARYLLNNHYDINKHSFAMQETVFSRAVQYGAGYIVELFNEALNRLSPAYINLSYVDDKSFDEGMIISIYDFLIEECQNAWQLSNGSYHSPKDWANGSYDVVKIGLKNRFEKERDDLLELLRNE